MRNIIETVIEREAERLDAIFEAPELLDGPAYPWTPTHTRVSPLTHKFSPRGARRARFTRATQSKRQYLN